MKNNIKSLYLIDSKKYIEKNCYQDQLFKAIQSGYDVDIFEHGKSIFHF